MRSRRSGVEVRKRLVAQNEPGVADQRAGERDALLLAAGQLVRVAVGRARRARLGRASPGAATGTRRGDVPAARSANATLSVRSCAATGRSPGRPSTGRAAPAARAATPSATVASPIVIRPEAIRSMPARHRSSVVLPDPNGPSSTEERARLDVERDVVERLGAARVHLAQPLDRDPLSHGRLPRSGASPRRQQPVAAEHDADRDQARRDRQHRLGHAHAEMVVAEVVLDRDRDRRRAGRVEQLGDRQLEEHRRRT